MVRPYGMKGKKRKQRQERYDKEEEDGEEEQQRVEEEEEEEKVKKAKMESTSGAEEDEEEKEKDEEGGGGTAGDELEGIPIAPSNLGTKKSGIVFVLEKASLEVAKVGKTYQLLNSDDHSNFLRKNNRNPADYRPDIAHQALLMILDSPVNKAGMLKAVYVRTEKGVLFEVKPHVRIPRTFKRFAGVMLQLLQKLNITAAGKREKLLRVIKNPVTQYLPVNSRKIGFSYSSDKLVNMQKHLAGVCNNMDLVFVLGAMAHGKIECDYIEDFLAISGYPLSAAYCVSRICEALSTNWNIL
ncbi:PREDICTED: ribosomal RNA small subunit methyltransferase NEP1-like [Tarenaya hassleriana]|uniref:ribosomal RNA small subunit methyltransferase NEP1-like n=1 Tax=Tarenaya hassleriana TaxID=28532 RepID=UPI00053C1D2C|nr:PREDICTED: ribosomal RNA small subunit methyltransferase NEP1-like [Tarenaya hassleriana]XP_010525476.1 PREDICTED: ribosomal RNA small subunit methyltransferase NEP1-like [Tarenaya hassleriana]